MSKRHREEKGDTVTREKLERPKRYKVLLLNDDFTTMEFVVFVLKQVFHLSSAAATRIMLQVHKLGVGVAGVYTREIAETRVAQVEKLAREAGHPLECTMEPE
ncbi:MAG: ATP-dependent Clp protease adapter ClpS [Proteobacteria bacterium]|jgi:ATP-dependent Clp protease adaptor protein ClpS|nr:ATP-dependent Clp protease adapter ClpS [Pseudomonadota bacterium]